MGVLPRAVFGRRPRTSNRHRGKLRAPVWSGNVEGLYDPDAKGSAATAAIPAVVRPSFQPIQAHRARSVFGPTMDGHKRPSYGAHGEYGYGRTARLRLQTHNPEARSFTTAIQGRRRQPDHFGRRQQVHHAADGCGREGLVGHHKWKFAVFLLLHLTPKRGRPP